MLDAYLEKAVAGFIRDEELPVAYRTTVERWFLPLVAELASRVAGFERPFVIGVSGCQGSGKSTLARLMALLLDTCHGLRTVALSLDDFYLTRAERVALAETVHPLLATRGVPGTHDVDLAVRTMQALGGHGTVALPRFNKLTDDRASRETWPIVAAPVDAIVLEGWCLGIGPEPEASLITPLNELEASEDPDGAWRRYVNRAAARDYPALYRLVDYLVMLEAPSFDCVYDWRLKQEQQLSQRLAASGLDATGNRVMQANELRRFIQHYERLTRHGFETLPQRANRVFRLARDQSVAGAD